MMRPAALLACLLVGAVAAPARADVVVQALGSARVAGGDSAKAREQALDDAFKQAVGQVITALVEPAEREAKADLIKKRISRRARSFVVTHKILDEGEEDALYSVQIEASVSDTALAAELKSLKIALAGATNPEPEREPENHRTIRPKIALLVVAPDDAADPGPLSLTLEGEIAASGFAVVTLATARAGIDDEQAAKLARDGGATVVVVATLGVRDGGRIRGTRQLGVEAEISFRLVDDTGKGPERIGDGRVADAGFGADAAAAGVAAVQATARRAARALVPMLVGRWPAGSGGSGGSGVDGGVLVELRQVTRWKEVATAVKALATTPGVEKIVPHALARGRVTLVVVGKASPKTIATALSGAGLPAAATAGGGVRVELNTAGDDR